MKVEEQGNDFIKLNLIQEGNIDDKIFYKIQRLECVVPFELMHEEKNRVKYHKGEMLSLAEYLNLKTISYDEVKNLFLGCADAYEQLEYVGASVNNLLPDLSCAYIDPVSQQMQFVYIPVMLELYQDSFITMMSELLFSIKSKHSDVVLGCIADAIGKYKRKEIGITEFKKQVVEAQSDVKIVEKEIEVDRIVEKIIEKPAKTKYNIGNSLAMTTMLYSVALILLPIVLSEFMDETMVSAPAILNILFCLVAILLNIMFSSYRVKKEQDDKVVITMEPQKRVDNR